MNLEPMKDSAAAMIPSVSLTQIPTVTELHAISLCLVSEDPWIAHLKKLKAKTWKRRINPIVRILGTAVSRFLGEKSWGRFLKDSWECLIDICIEQVARNRKLLGSNTISKADLAPFAPRGKRKFSRSLNQLPCTKATLKSRLEIVRENCKLDEAILLLGDDDLLSVMLLEAGYSDITVIDVDPHLLRCIEEEAARTYGKSINTALHDLRDPLPKGLLRNYRFVILDPPCTPEGLQLFLQRGIELTMPSPQFFVCTHLMSQYRDGIEALKHMLTINHLSIERVYLGFNLYPLPPRVRRCVKLCAWLLDRSFFQKNMFVPSHFISDALLLSRNRNSGCL